MLWCQVNDSKSFNLVTTAHFWTIWNALGVQKDPAFVVYSEMWASWKLFAEILFHSLTLESTLIYFCLTKECVCIRVDPLQEGIPNGKEKIERFFSPSPPSLPPPLKKKKLMRAPTLPEYLDNQVMVYRTGPFFQLYAHSCSTKLPKVLENIEYQLCERWGS